jgi:hypothetical protein
MMQCRVEDEGLRVVNSCHWGTTSRFIAYHELTQRGRGG